MVNLIYAILPIIAMMIGFYFGFTLKKEDKLPEFKSPKKIIEEKKELKKEKQEINELTTYLENIDNYPYKQKEIKER